MCWTVFVWFVECLQWMLLLGDWHLMFVKRIWSYCWSRNAAPGFDTCVHSLSCLLFYPSNGGTFGNFQSGAFASGHVLRCDTDVLHCCCWGHLQSVLVTIVHVTLIACTALPGATCGQTELECKQTSSDCMSTIVVPDRNCIQHRGQHSFTCWLC